MPCATTPDRGGGADKHSQKEATGYNLGITAADRKGEMMPKSNSCERNTGVRLPPWLRE